MIVRSHVGEIEFELVGIALEAVVEVLGDVCSRSGVLAEVEGSIARVGCWVLVLMWECLHV